MKHSYKFLTTFTVTASRTLVWNTLMNFSSWQEWWWPLRRVIDHGDRIEFTVGSSLWYTLTFSILITEKTEAYTSFSVMGELEGSGSFDCSESGGSTTVRFTWTVISNKPWMNKYAPLLRPVFILGHTIVMRQFAKGFARFIKSALVSVKNTEG